jgi:hypothetical protein
MTAYALEDPRGRGRGPGADGTEGAESHSRCRAFVSLPRAPRATFWIEDWQGRAQHRDHGRLLFAVLSHEGPRHRKCHMIAAQRRVVGRGFSVRSRTRCARRQGVVPEQAPPIRPTPATREGSGTGRAWGGRPDYDLLMGAGASMNRRLVAILAADIAGYSRLMHEDEAATVRDLKAHQGAVLPLIARVSQRRRCYRMRDPDPDRDGRAQPDRARASTHALSHRHQPRRCRP